MNSAIRTKIVATLGPATDSPEQIESLLQAGVDLFRLNFSHGTHEEHERRVRWIRDAEARLGRPVGILQDLQGPKLRIGKFQGGEAAVWDGQEFRLDADPAPGDNRRVCVPVPELIRALRPGHTLLLKDGEILLQVLQADANGAVTRVVAGGTLTDRCGIHVRDVDLDIPALSDKDLRDVEFGAALGVDWVALSFVRTADDLRQARRRLAELRSPARLMAKIETPSAVARFSEILAEADGIMIARGDLGVTMRPEQVPGIQKRLIRACVDAAKPVITATQMMQSMVESPTPTRAEASDVANAVFDGTDAVMLSAETSIGRHPIAAVRMMDQIARAVEGSEDYRQVLHRYPPRERPPIPDAICHSACRLAQILPARAIVPFTRSGSTAAKVSSHRPAAVVAALTPSQTIARQLTVAWGVFPIVIPEPPDPDRLAQIAIARVLAAGLACPGELVVITGGVSAGGPANAIRVERIPEFG